MLITSNVICCLVWRTCCSFFCHLATGKVWIRGDLMLILLICSSFLTLSEISQFNHYRGHKLVLHWNPLCWEVFLVFCPSHEMGTILEIIIIINWQLCHVLLSCRCFHFKSVHPKLQVCFRIYNRYHTLSLYSLSLMGLMFIWVAYIFYRGTYCHSRDVGVASFDCPVVYRHAKFKLQTKTW